MKCWVEGSRSRGQCVSMVWSHWIGKLATVELHTVPATQKAEGSLGSLVRGQCPLPPSPNTEIGTAIVRSIAQKNLEFYRF